MPDQEKWETSRLPNKLSRQGLRFPEEADFIATRDMVDSLILDASATPPRYHTVVKECAERISHHFAEGWGEFMSAETKNLLKSAKDRVLVVPKAPFITLDRDWGTSFSIKRPKPGGTLLKEGRIALVDDFTVKWRQMRKQPNIAKPVHISPQHLMWLVSLSVVTSAMAEEIAHMIHEPNLFKLFQESGASFYRTELAETVGFLVAYEGPVKARVEHYEKLLAKYGDTVHKTFFGTEPDEEAGLKIQCDFTKEYMDEMKLFG